jgi:predicted histone-like DNA-binding protein
MDELVKEVSEISTVSEGDVYAVVTSLKNLVIKKIQNGESVELFKMGYFYPTIKSEGVKVAKDFTKKNIKDYSLKFRLDSNFKRDLKDIKTKIEYPIIDTNE